jgi:hypothetical protein
LEFLARKIRQERRKKRNLNRKERSQTTLICRRHDVLHKRFKNFTKKLLDIINSFSKVAGYKINLQKPVAFLYANNEHTEKEYRKTTPFAISILRNKIPRNKLKQESERILR